MNHDPEAVCTGYYLFSKLCTACLICQRHSRYRALMDGGGLKISTPFLTPTRLAPDSDDCPNFVRRPVRNFAISISALAD